MQIDCNIYKESLDKISHLLRDTKNPTYHASQMAGITHIPAIAVIIYMLTYTHPSHPDLIKAKASLIDFYGYTRIDLFRD